MERCREAMNLAGRRPKPEPAAAADGAGPGPSAAAPPPGGAAGSPRPDRAAAADAAAAAAAAAWQPLIHEAIDDTCARAKALQAQGVDVQMVCSFIEARARRRRHPCAGLCAPRRGADCVCL
jgi:hypothetical protein